jgi:diguanylate cyclase (GGDEF)-like protein
MADLYVLGRFYLANAAYIVLLIVSVRLNEQYIRARTLAEMMTRLAHTDTLIQIPNRRELDETIAREVNRAKRHHQPLSVIMFDLDHFKQVNDTYGHDVGDAVLKASARVVRGLLRSSDVLGRWGGEEFLVVAPQTDCVQARSLAERLRQAVANARLNMSAISLPALALPSIVRKNRQRLGSNTPTRRCTWQSRAAGIGWRCLLQHPHKRLDRFWIEMCAAVGKNMFAHFLHAPPLPIRTIRTQDVPHIYDCFGLLPKPIVAIKTKLALQTNRHLLRALE